MIKAAVLGSPISHSLSPVIHYRAYEILGWKWRYEKHEVQSGNLAGFLQANPGQFRGISLTMPLKEEALDLLDTVSELAKQVNGANTIVFDDFGSHGHNTDVQGFRDAFSFHRVEIPETVAILGGGATARAAIAAVDGIAKSINVFSRSADRSRGLVNSALTAIVNVHSWSEVEQSFAEELIISTTPKGATDDLIPREMSGAFFESLYSPWPTPLLERWQNSGRATLDGLDLLVWQAIGQLELMGFDEEVFVERKSELHGAMRSAALALLIQ
jgi:shikimate dehydrogenase